MAESKTINRDVTATGAAKTAMPQSPTRRGATTSIQANDEIPN